MNKTKVLKTWFLMIKINKFWVSFSPVSEQQTRVLDQRSTLELELIHTRPRARLRRQRNNKKLDISQSNRDVLQQFGYTIFD